MQSTGSNESMNAIRCIIEDMDDGRRNDDQAQLGLFGLFCQHVTLTELRKQIYAIWLLLISMTSWKHNHARTLNSRQRRSWLTVWLVMNPIFSASKNAMLVLPGSFTFLGLLVSRCGGMNNTWDCSWNDRASIHVHLHLPSRRLNWLPTGKVVFLMVVLLCCLHTCDTIETKNSMMVYRFNLRTPGLALLASKR
jgi:hypothetical protein